MATFAEICERVFDEVDGRPVQFTTVNLGRDADGELYITDPTQRNVVRWVKDAFRRIQQETDHWKFLHKRGVFITSVANVTDYTKRNVREVDETSLYCIKSGSTGRSPMSLVPYSWWQGWERAGDSSSGQPSCLIEMPEENKWKLWPTPTGVWTVYADYWLKPYEFEAADDEPLWDSEYDDLLTWMAIQLLSDEFSNEEKQAQVLLKRVDRNLPALLERFRDRYYPQFEGPTGFGC
jgi:hypothetical protein